MKTGTAWMCLVFLLMINACKKSGASLQYQTLGTYDSSGKPNYLLPRDSISDSLTNYINTILPPGQNIETLHPELLNSDADIKINQQSDVYVTFVSEGSGLTNSIGFYTYSTNLPPSNTKDIKTITYIFPSCGLNTPLHPGDRVKIGRFDAGTSVGFVLLQGGWDITQKTFNKNVVYFWTTDILNPESNPNLKKHAILLDYVPENKALIGFEDFDRTKPQCDNDFNDQVIYCTLSP